MNEENTYRITKVTAAFMITVALIFDLAQIASMLLALMGLATLGGIIGVLACSYLGIDAPKECTVAGGLVGAGISLVPVVGTILAVTATKIGIVLSELASSAFMLIGYATLYLWFHLRGVPIFSGNKMQKKAVVGFLSLLVDFIPLIKMLPGLTVWTTTTVYITRSEDKASDSEAQMGYNGKNSLRMRRRYLPLVRSGL